MINTGVIQW